MVTRAIIVAPPGPRGATARDECWSYCLDCGYEVVAVVPATRAGVMEALDATLTSRAEVIVAARRAHLAPDRVPRVEVVAEERQRRRRPGDRPRPRRPDHDARPG